MGEASGRSERLGRTIRGTKRNYLSTRVLPCRVATWPMGGARGGGAKPPRWVMLSAQLMAARRGGGGMRPPPLWTQGNGAAHVPCAGGRLSPVGPCASGVNGPGARAGPASLSPMPPVPSRARAACCSDSGAHGELPPFCTPAMGSGGCVVRGGVHRAWRQLALRPRQDVEKVLPDRVLGSLVGIGAACRRDRRWRRVRA